jgi:hypothetical protein
MRYHFSLLLFLIVSIVGQAQKKGATVTGRVVDENNAPFVGVNVTILGKQSGIATKDSGKFSLKVAAEKRFAIEFSYAGYKTVLQNFYLLEGETEVVEIVMEPGDNKLVDVVVKNRPRNVASKIEITNAKLNSSLNPSPVNSIESLVKIFAQSNNELTNNYNVRGGNFDENLIYVNDFEIFRPYLIRNGQQEGLSFINPELTRTVEFYNGGFSAKYGDKMSSVLDVKYEQPKNNGGSVFLSLLEQGFSLHGVSNNDRFTYLLGARNRSNRNLLSSQEVKGNYVPSSSDIQALLTYRLSPKWNVELLMNYSRNSFDLSPEESNQETSVFSPLFSLSLGLQTFYEGQEKDGYQTNMFGLSIGKKVDSSLSYKFLLSRFQNVEEENIDIIGAYQLGERDIDRSSPTFGQISRTLAVGEYHVFSRNRLNIEVWNASFRGEWKKQQHVFSWGLTGEQYSISDKLKEWERTDSLGFTLPYRPGNPLNLTRYINSNTSLEVTRLSGFLQDNYSINKNLFLQAGVRFNYNNLNNEFFVSPRVGLSYTPTNNMAFRLAVGSYNQPPFYRELRNLQGDVNKNVLSQKSWQVSGGWDFNFKYAGRPFRLNAEAYYKSMTDVVAYDIDNVRLRYFGQNNAKAYAAGVELRLFGELVKDAESWISIGLMETKEDLTGDRYKQYYNAAGNPIAPGDAIKDSAIIDVGYVRRPTDRFINFGMFFQDYLTTNKNSKVFLNFIYGSDLPYNIPGNARYRNALTINPYWRIDIGFSFLLLDTDKSKRRSHNPFRGFDNIWASFEVFNLIDKRNTISYQLIKDFNNTVYTIPNSLTPRLINLKLVARW